MPGPPGGAAGEAPAADAFWRFSLGVYGRPGVAAACLALQDRDGLDVNLLLFAAWMGHERGLRLGAAGVQAAAGTVAAWQAEVVAPLRALRRRLKEGPPPAPDAATGAMREHLKAVELEADRVEQNTLQRFAATIPAELAPAGPALAAENMRAVAGLARSGTDARAATWGEISAITAALGVGA